LSAHTFKRRIHQSLRRKNIDCKHLSKEQEVKNNKNFPFSKEEGKMKKENTWQMKKP